MKGEKSRDISGDERTASCHHLSLRFECSSCRLLHGPVDRKVEVEELLLRMGWRTCHVARRKRSAGRRYLEDGSLLVIA